MPGTKKSKKPVSKAQARLFGAIASGAAKSTGMSRAEARRKLQGAKITKLPGRAGKKAK